MASKSKLGQAAETSVNGFFTNVEENKPESEPVAKESQKPLYTDEQMDEALKTVYRTGRQQDGADLLGINKGTFSRKKREIEENEPERAERLKAEIAAEKKAFIKDTSQTAQQPAEHSEPIQTKSTPEEETHVYEANTKPQKAVMGFRAEVDKIELWKLYADSAEQEISAMCTAALDEYIRNHELTADQKEIFDIKKQALEAEKRIKNRNNK